MCQRVLSVESTLSQLHIKAAAADWKHRNRLRQRSPLEIPRSKWTKFIQRVCFVPNNTTLDTFFKIYAPFILSLYLHTCLLWICFISRQSFPLLPIIVWAGGTFLVLPPQKASLYILSILGLHFIQACARPGQFSEIAITVQKKCKQTVWPLFCFDMWQNLLYYQILWIVCA